uniref:Uncharacterized protein n=1 Tax=Anguilla anguilla TaxID=7936 RepID=A0A0E9TW40_ANGAN
MLFILEEHLFEGLHKWQYTPRSLGLVFPMVNKTVYIW